LTIRETCTDARPDCPQEGLEMRARLVLATVERQMREAGLLRVNL